MWVDNDVPNFDDIEQCWIFCDIVAAILKMATGRNFSMLAINSGHHYLPTYQILMISGNVEFLPPIFYTVFWPELIANIEKFLADAIFKMATTIPHKFNIVRFQRHFICG
jgi:hypothetical protein